MENNKLGQEPSFPFFKENEVGYGDTIVVNDQFGVKGFYPFEKGMSKRFYAACAAMQGLIANAYIQSPRASDEDLIKKSYELADELLKQENEN